ncbi:ArnT family glycosyltransferase [Micromonospora sp. NBC_01813]|uniref:ArnT family glycosyltransferase n=1 Tax=Micromonospora sp. NBC_01813 TaxID=2975988 RepID=UPI002DDAEBD9|nr:hypothetical protein [Micromonospora sp. NBC_01813]WSA07300.1 hypothetical protein OG958_24015 [Micromonospora sp. NBC_01813]
MPAGWIIALIAPPLLFLLAAFLAWPTGSTSAAETVAPVRRTVVLAALTTGGFAVVAVESLGAAEALTGWALAAAWLTALVVLAAAAARRWRRAVPSSRPRAAVALRALAARSRRRVGQAWASAGRGERLLAGTIGAMLSIELIVALLAEPNNVDSQTYHLPKVEHWAAQGTLEFWPTAIHRQVTIPPGAEYLLLHLRLLTGGDALHNLLQWLAGIGCLLIVTRIVAQLGGTRRAQLIAAFAVATTPMVVLQATSTQTDLVVAAWTGCVATLALDGLRRPATVGAVLALGTATGLTAITKTSGLLGVGPMLVLWGLGQLRLSGWLRRPGAVLRTGAASLAILAVAGVFVGPFLARVANEFGHPLGPPRLRESIPMQRHDPAAVLVNGLRIGHTALDTPFAPLRAGAATVIVAVAEAIGVDPQDPEITFHRTEFPVPSWYPDEDRVAFPLAGGLALVAGALALCRPRLVAPLSPGTARAYAVTVATALVLYFAMIKWQPWGNRLLLFCLILASPLIGLWLDSMFRRRGDRRRDESPDDRHQARRRRSVAVTLAATVLATSALSGVLAVSYGFPRRLVGAGSVFTTDPWETRFLRRPDWAADFRWAAAEVRRADVQRVGLVQQNITWEYPLWLLLPDHEIVALQSVLPDRPPADPESVEIIVCLGDRDDCTELVPADWTLEFRGYLGVANPPA